MKENLEVVIKGDTKPLQKELKKAENQLEEFEKKSIEADKALDELIDSAKTTAKDAFTTIAGSITAVVAAMTGIAESTREYRQEQNKLVASFESAGSSAETAKNTYDELYRVLGEEDTAVEAAAHLAQLTTNEKDLAEWTETCKGVYATFGKSLPIEGLTEAANETAKVGKVTGVLADAINWAGESEEDFNAELAECATTQEREEKIRKKLNSLYKNAATEYETTAKKTLKANEAQNKLNSAMAQAGEDFQPVSDALKDIGSTALKEFRAPLKKTADVISKDVLPVVKDIIKFMADNLPAVAGLFASATAAVGAYKISVGLAALESKGLTLATAAQAAAQEALNAVMKMNPYLLVASALAILTTGAIAYAVAARDAGVDTGILSEAEKEVISRSKEAAEEFKNLQDTLANDAAGTVSSFEHTQQLADELKTLADESGNVAEKDRARAEFILGELNTALGTEYQMTDGVITKYTELKDSIDKVIESKRVNALLEAYNEEYVTALKNEKDAFDALNSVQKEYNEIGERVKELEAEKLEANQAYIEALESGDDRAIASAKEALDEATAAWGNESLLYAEKKQELDKVKDNYNNVAVAVARYELASEESLKGNYEAAEKYLGMTDEEFLEATNQMIDSSGQLVKAVKTDSDDIAKKYNDVFTGIINTAKNKKPEYKKAGQDLVNGMKDGMNNNSGLLAQAAAGVVNSALAAMRNAADIHSPSRITKKYGKYIDEGLSIGIEDNTGDVIDSAKNMINETLKPIESNISVRDLQISSNPSIGINNSLKLSYDNNQSIPIILEIDGKTLAQTSINSINQLTKQTGKLGLNLF